MGKSASEYAVQAGKATPRPWRPIATAPKDGSVVLLCNEDDGLMMNVVAMRWDPEFKNGFFPQARGMWVTPDESMTWNGTPDNFGPTHWTPLAQQAGHGEERG